MVGLREFTDGIVWDTESRMPKPEDMPWDVYRDRGGISIAVVVPLGVGALDGIEFYSDSDEPPWDPQGLAARLGGASIAVGYKSRTWDRGVVAGASGLQSPTTNELDLYEVLTQALANEGTRRWPKGTWTLDAVCGRTFAKHKTLKGAFAPTLAEQGRWGELVKYCLTDVLLTRRLAWHMGENGYVVGPDDRIVEVHEVMTSELSRIRRAQAAVRAA